MSNAVRRQAGDQLGSRGVREPLLPQTPAARNATQNASGRREMRQRMRNEQANPANVANQPAFTPMQGQGLQPNMQANMQTNLQAANFVAPNPLPNQSQATLLTPQNFVPQGTQPLPPLNLQNQEQAPEQPTVRKVTYTTNKPKRRQQKLGQNVIRTLDLDRKFQPQQPQGVNAGLGQIQGNTAPIQPSYVQPTAPGAIMQPPAAPMQMAGASQKSDKESAYSIPPLTAGDLRT